LLDCLFAVTKKVKGRKRHIVVDTMGLLVSAAVHPADVQDRDGSFQLPCRTRRLFPFIERIFAEDGYAGKKMALVVWRTAIWQLQVVKRSDAAGFSRNRRLARDFERYATTVIRSPRNDPHHSGGSLQTLHHESKLPGWL
jgi:Transposase DDE domain